MREIHITRLRLLALFFFFLSFEHLDAQVVPSDTSSTDTTRLTGADTLRRPITAITLVGSVGRTFTTANVIADSSINFMDYRYAGDLLEMTPGVFVRDLGTPGQLHGLTIQGLDARSITFMNDGVSLNDPLTGVYNLYLYPSENIDRIEFIRGTEAFLYGLNSTGGAINFVSRSMKAFHPFTRIRYSESVYGFGFFDGMFSQNITRALNVTASLQHVTNDGEFPNSDDDSWNARLKLRYNLNKKLNFFASEIFNRTQVGLSGGVDTTVPIGEQYVPLPENMKNTESYEKITRHDLQLGASGAFFPDSDWITTLTLYHTTNLREYRDEENRVYSNGIYLQHLNGIFVQQDHWSQQYGAKLTQHVEAEAQDVDLGAEIQSRGLIASSVMPQHLEALKSLYAKDRVRISNIFAMTAGARFDGYLGSSRLSYGADGSLASESWITFFGGYSLSHRFPTFQELYWHDTIVNSPQSTFSPERHHLAEAGVRFSNTDGTTYVEMTYSHRIINDAIEILPTYVDYPFPTLQFVRMNRETFNGITGSAHIRFGEFLAEGSAQYVEVTDDYGTQSFVPKWSGIGGIYFWDKVFKNHLDIKVGVRGRFLYAYRGMEYNPQAWMYVPSAQPDVKTSGVSDFVLDAHLGDAYIHIIWQNLLDLQYVTTPFYPMVERSLRFGLSWEFAD